MTASPDYDAPLSAIREHAEDLATWLAVWESRSEPDAHARRCAADGARSADCGWPGVSMAYHGTLQC